MPRYWASLPPVQVAKSVRLCPSLQQIVGQAEWEEFQFLLNVVNAASHEAFDGVDGALGGFGQILSGRVADDRLTIFVERNDRGNEIRTIFTGDDDRALPLHEGHERVRGSEVDSDDAIRGHCVILRSGHLAIENFWPFNRSIAR